MVDVTPVRHTTTPPRRAPGTPLLEVCGVSKRFPGVLANDAVSLELFEGEVHALLGENGAGKTTLISMLYGLYLPDEGHLRLGGKRVTLRAPSEALAAGIGLVAQHFNLVGRHTVAENIALGLSGLPFWRPTRRLKKHIIDLGERYGLLVDPDAHIDDLSAGEQQRVEIMKALIRNARILILDEPTGVLTPREAENLFVVIERMKREGHGVIFITHKLKEVLRVADHITVLRKGRVVGALERPGADERRLAKLMVGREVSLARSEPAPHKEQVALELRGVSTLSSRGTDALRGVSFELRAGEILGVAGVAGNGQLELAELLTGHRHLKAGTITLAGKPVQGGSVRSLFEAGVAHIPEDRRSVGVVPALAVSDNVRLRHYRYPPLSRGGVLNPRAAVRIAREAVTRFGVATPSVKHRTGALSGGNIQKLILARELAKHPHGAVQLVIAAHPTFGLDISATEQTHSALLETCARGAAMLLISEDLDELMRLSHRILVLFGGEVMGIVNGSSATREQLGLMMAGRHV